MKKIYLPKKTKFQRNNPFAILDIGSAKTVCLIAENNGDTTPIVKGIGQHASIGMRNGEVVDLAALSVVVGKTIEVAENMAGVKIDSIIVGLSGGRQESTLYRHEIDVPDNIVTNHEITQLLHEENKNPLEDRLILHRLPLHYTLDNVKGIYDPLGMSGKRLGIELCHISVAESTIKNLTAIVERNHVKVERFVANTYASALSTLTRDEKDLGAVIIEMGAGITTIAIFSEEQLLYIDSIPIGGQHVTADIAKGVSTPMDEAERIKNLHGTTFINISSENDQVITLPTIGEKNSEKAQQIKMSLLSSIIRSRIEEIFEIMQQRLEKKGISKIAAQRIVLAGGTAQLTGIAEYLSTFFKANVRIGKPTDITGLTDATKGSAFSASTGLLHFGLNAYQLEAQIEQNSEPPKSTIGKITQWFKTYV